MIENNIYCSYDLEEDCLDFLCEINSDSQINLGPYEKLKNIQNNPILIGGGRDQCLYEIYLLLEAMGKNPTINNNYIY